MFSFTKQKEEEKPSTLFLAIYNLKGDESNVNDILTKAVDSRSGVGQKAAANQATISALPEVEEKETNSTVDSADEITAAEETGSSMERDGYLGWSPLMLASYRGNVAALRFLLGHKSGADVDYQSTNTGETALMVAVKGPASAIDKNHVVSILKQYGVKLDLQDQQGKTVLMHAIESKYDPTKLSHLASDPKKLTTIKDKNQASAVTHALHSEDDRMLPAVIEVLDLKNNQRVYFTLEDFSYAVKRQDDGKRALFLVEKLVVCGLEVPAKYYQALDDLNEQQLSDFLTQLMRTILSNCIDNSGRFRYQKELCTAILNILDKNNSELAMVYLNAALKIKRISHDGRQYAQLFRYSQSLQDKSVWHNFSNIFRSLMPVKNQDSTFIINEGNWMVFGAPLLAKAVEKKMYEAVKLLLAEVHSADCINNNSEMANHLYALAMQSADTLMLALLYSSVTDYWISNSDSIKLKRRYSDNENRTCQPTKFAISKLKSKHEWLQDIPFSVIKQTNLQKILTFFYNIRIDTLPPNMFLDLFDHCRTYEKRLILVNAAIHCREFGIFQQIEPKLTAVSHSGLAQGESDALCQLQQYVRLSKITGTYNYEKREYEPDQLIQAYKEYVKEQKIIEKKADSERPPAINPNADIKQEDARPQVASPIISPQEIKTAALAQETPKSPKPAEHLPSLEGIAQTTVSMEIVKPLQHERGLSGEESKQHEAEPGTLMEGVDNRPLSPFSKFREEEQKRVTEAEQIELQMRQLEERKAKMAESRNIGIITTIDALKQLLFSAGTKDAQDATLRKLNDCKQHLGESGKQKIDGIVHAYEAFRTAMATTIVVADISNPRPSVSGHFGQASSSARGVIVADDKHIVKSVEESVKPRS